MLTALYAPGGVDVRVAPFEKTPLPKNWFDLAIGNVPFGKYKVADLSNRAYARFSIHNYFLGRALDLVRPGGLVCFITTSYTMDALDDAARQYIGAQAHLLGAIQLPQGAFAGIASTDVQTDILFLRKREPGEAVGTDWLKLSIVPDALRHPHCHERYLQINAWYATHPEFCIGSIRTESNGYAVAVELPHVRRSRDKLVDELCLDQCRGLRRYGHRAVADDNQAQWRHHAYHAHHHQRQGPEVA